MLIRKLFFKVLQPRFLCKLQTIKAATEESLCGDRISEELLDAADDLYHLRIPSKWSKLGGDSSPPFTWSLAGWFTDLGNRFSHIDRIIVQVNGFCFAKDIYI